MALPPPEPAWIEAVRRFLPPVLALASAVLLDWLCAARGFLPPGFTRPVRRGLGFVAVAFFFWIALYGNLANLGREAPPLDLTHLTAPRLFLVHFLMIGTMLVWFLAGYAGLAPLARPAPVPLPEPEREAVADIADIADIEPLPGPPEEPVPPLALPPPRPPLGRTLAAQLGLLAPDVPREIGIGLLAGVGSWFLVILAALVVALILYAVGGEGVAPTKPPELIVWIAGLPLGVRILAALSAGVVEESFFRGFLQPRIGLWLSSAFFVLGHLAYGQPLLLVGITVLSLLYGTLVRWRQNIWPAIAAHILFDGVQLLVFIPLTLKLLGKGLR